MAFDPPLSEYAGHCAANGRCAEKSDDDGKQRCQWRCKTDGKQAGGDPGYDKGDGNANEKGGGEVVGHGKDGAPAAIEKKPLRQNIKHTRIKSKLKERRYSMLPAITARIAGKDACKKAGQSCTSTKAGNAKTQRQEDGVLHALLGGSCLPTPIFCATIAARAAEKAVGGKAS